MIWPGGIIIIIHHFPITFILSISLYECFGCWSFLPSTWSRKFSLNNRCEQSNQNVLLTSQGWCIFDWLPNFHVECFMYLCKLSSSIHLFVVHFVTCHHLLTSQRFCSQKLFLLVSFFFPVSKHISQCLAWSSHFSQSPSSVKPVYLADKHFGTYLLFLLTLTFSFFGIQMSTGKIKWKEAWKVNSPISAPTIGNVLAGVKLSGAHQTSYGLWQPLNENISVTMQTKLDCFSVMCHWWRAEKASSSSLHKSPLNMEGQCQRM